MILIILYFYRWAIAKYGNITKLRKEKQWVPRSDFGLGIFAILWQSFFEKNLGK